jgi:hypothetical protein
MYTYFFQEHNQGTKRGLHVPGSGMIAWLTAQNSKQTTVNGTTLLTRQKFLLEK